MAEAVAPERNERQRAKKGRAQDPGADWERCNLSGLRERLAPPSTAGVVSSYDAVRVDFQADQGGLTDARHVLPKEAPVIGASFSRGPRRGHSSSVPAIKGPPPS